MANESTRITLLKCMRKLVRENSFSKISINMICETAHISRRTFYRYFYNRYSLLAATYNECYFAKLTIEKGDNFWHLFGNICQQIYDEPAFFRHVFDVKGQNGFWEEAKSTLAPYMTRDFPVTPDIKDIVDFYVFNDLDVLFQHIEGWIKGGFKYDPKSFSTHVRDSFKVHGKWIYELATDRPVSPYSQHKIDKKEW